MAAEPPSTAPKLPGRPEPASIASSLPTPPLTPTLERAATVARALTSDTAESEKERRERIVRELSCHFSLFVAGWGDASSGPLIPYIQAHYGISYTVVSMLFLGQAVGFIAAGLACAPLTEKYGLGKVIVVGSALQALAYALLIAAFPFPAMPVLYAVGGLGLALQDAQANVYVAGLPNSEKKLGWLHGSYGLGAACSPLAGTAFAAAGILFARFWAVSLSIAALNIALLLYAFKFSYVTDTSEPVKLTVAEPGLPPAQVGEAFELSERHGPTSDASVTEKSIHGDEETGQIEVPQLDTSLPSRTAQSSWKDNVLIKTLSSRTTSFAILFCFLYVGSEVSMGGWIVTWVRSDRNGGSDAGYIASGFWFGLMLGRFLLNPLTARLGESNAVLLYTFIAMALEFSVWFADSLVGNGVVVGVIGFLLGPSYPILVSVISKLLPRHQHAPAIALVAAFGQVGSAVFPFITGALATRFSPVVLHPIMVILLGCQLISFAGIPRVARKAE
ncbi:hypothetical protein JCM10213_004102 [Rhodosporidiobolus nylandii]